MKKRLQNAVRVVKTTTKSATQPPASPAERKLRIAYWAGAVVLVAVKIYMVIHG